MPSGNAGHGAGTGSPPGPNELAELLRPSPIVLDAAEPIFIIGSVRSGTSVMMNALREGAGIRGFSEGNVASLMQRMLDEVERHFKNLSPEYLQATSEHLVANSDQRAIETHVVNYFAALYARHMGPGRWLDKSPESYLTAPMIRSCPKLSELFPKARFIFCIRRPIENILSRQRKFPGIPFASYCRSWSDAVVAWGEVREKIPGRFLEIRQEEIALNPAEVARRLQAFLGLDDVQRGRVEDILAHRRYEQSQVAQEHRQIGLDETPWTPDERAAFLRICGPIIKNAGYSIEGKVVRAGTPVQLFYPVVADAVELSNVSAEGGGFTSVETGALQIPANAPGGPPAEVRYLAIPLLGQTRFRAELSLGSKDAGPVGFSFRIEESGTRTPVARFERVLEHGSPAVWEVGFPELRGRYDLVLGAAMPPGARSAQPALARFRNPELL